MQIWKNKSTKFGSKILIALKTGVLLLLTLLPAFLIALFILSIRRHIPPVIAMLLGSALPAWLIGFLAFSGILQKLLKRC